MPHFLTFPAHMPVIAGIRLEGYQVCTHYFILKWGKTRENEDITESIKREIFGHHYGLKKATKKDREIPVSTTLADPNKDVTKQADRIVCRSREYWEFFKGAADKVIEDWEVDVKGMEPRNKDAA